MLTVNGLPIEDFSSAARGLTGKLRDLDDDELGRLQRREAHHDVDDAVLLVGRRGGGEIAFHLKRVVGGRALERALAEQRQQERTRSCF